MRPRLTTLFRWALAIAAIGVLLAFVDVAAIRTRLAATDLRIAVPAVIGLVVVHVIAVATWRRLLRSLAGVSVGVAASLRLYYAAQVLGTVTPANLGADVYRVLAIDVGASRARLARPVLIQRLTSVAALVILGIAGAMSLPIPGLGPFIAAAAIVGVVVVLIVIALVRPSLPGGWGARPARRLGWGSGPMWDGDRVRSAVRDGLGLGLAFHATSLLLALVLVVAVDPNTGARAGLVLPALAVARLSLAVPISPNGIGIQEGLLAILFAQLGLPADVAIAAGLLNRLGFLATAAVGVVCLLVGSTAASTTKVPQMPPTGRVERSSLRGGGA